MKGVTVTYKLERRMAARRLTKEGINAEADTESRAKAPRRGLDPKRLARLLAIAHHIADLVERGELRDFAHAARRLGLTRARMNQATNLLNLSPKIQEAILVQRLSVAERGLRPVLRLVEWEAQEHFLCCDDH